MAKQIKIHLQLKVSMFFELICFRSLLSSSRTFKRIKSFVYLINLFGLVLQQKFAHKAILLIKKNEKELTIEN
jgi:hypothetical protein